LSNAAIQPQGKRVTSFMDALFDIPEIPRTGTHQTKHLNDLRDAVVKSAQLEGYAVGLEQGRTEGYAVGTAEGEAQALVEAELQRNAMLDELSQELAIIVAEASAAIPAWCEMAEQAMTDRVSEICRRVLLRELELDRNSIVEMVREAMQSVTHGRTARLRVNPADAHVLMKHCDELRASVRSLENIEIVSDSSVIGGCVIETDGGSVGGSIECKLEVLDRRLDEEAA
jgi:flagellar assembly protein FliH